MRLRTRNPGLKSRRAPLDGTGGIEPCATRGRWGAGLRRVFQSERVGQPRRRAVAGRNPAIRQAARHWHLIVAALIAALCGGCGQDESSGRRVSELAGQWTGRENDGSEVVCVSLRGDGTFEWRQQQVAGRKDAWSRAGQWKPVSLLGEDGGGFTYCLKLNVDPGAGDAAAGAPQPGPYQVRLTSRRAAREWMLYAPWGEFRVERAVEHGERGSRGREGETHDG
jgi:hypothetical protein